MRVSSLRGPSERDFVLVAGIGVASDYYIRLALELNRVGSVHAIDLPGFGGVHESGRRLTIEDFADLVEAVVDDFGLTDPVLVGHSMGAQVATEVAARRSELSSLVLIGPVINAAERTVVRQSLRLAQCGLHEPFAILLHIVFSYILCGPVWFFRTVPQMMHYPIEERIGAVAAHTLILRGEHDSVCPPRWAAGLARSAPHARAWEVPAAAHSVMYKHAEAVAKLSIEHLRRSEGDDAARIDVQATPHPNAAPRWRRNGTRVAGAIVSLWGMARDDDELIAAGNRRQLSAVASYHDTEDATARPLS